MFGLLIAAALGSTVSPAIAQYEKSAWNESPDPQALYGHCQFPSSMLSKLNVLNYLSESVEGVLAIKVLHCSGANGAGGFTKVACPAGSAYDFCMFSGNDGAGNRVKLGVLRAGARTDANGNYDGCPDGATTQPKLKVLLSAGKDPRTVDALLTLSCSTATAPTATPADKVECPSGSPFGYCIGTPNDGNGNAVTLGVVRTHSTGDPHGLYGECDQQVMAGFASKLSVLPLVGRSTDNVRNIDILNCAVPWAFGGGFPSGLTSGPCVGNPFVIQTLAHRYDYCVVGTDSRNAGIVMGVNSN